MRERKFNVVFCILRFIRFIWSMLFKPQKLDIVLKRIQHNISSTSTTRYRRAEVLAKVLLSVDIFIFNPPTRRSKAYFSQHHSAFQMNLHEIRIVAEGVSRVGLFTLETRRLWQHFSTCDPQNLKLFEDASTA
jgi:hypothetical protein